MSGSRLTMTKAESETPQGLGFIELCTSLGRDGEFSDNDLQKILHLARSSTTQIPAIRHVEHLIADALVDGIITDGERNRIRSQIERVLPIAKRERLQMARGATFASTDRDRDPPSEAQLRYITNLLGSIPSGLTKSKASRLIDEILNSNESITSRQRMVLRFFGKDIEPQWGKRSVSDWLDNFFAEDPSRRNIWEDFKISKGDPNTPEEVPFGAWRQVVNRKPNDTPPLIMPLARPTILPIDRSNRENYGAAPIISIVIAVLAIVAFLVIHFKKS